MKISILKTIAYLYIPVFSKLFYKENIFRLRITNYPSYLGLTSKTIN